MFATQAEVPKHEDRASKQLSSMSDVQLAEYHYQKHQELLSSNPIAAISEL